MAETLPSKAVIMLVDDDKFLIDMYATKFTAAGYTVQTCLSAPEALSVLRGGFAPDAILLDLTMPEMDGFAFLRALADEKLAPKTLCIALTNQSDEEEKEQAAKLGVKRYIVKASYIPSEVVNLVAAELAEHQKA